MEEDPSRRAQTSHQSVLAFFVETATVREEVFPILRAMSASRIKWIVTRQLVDLVGIPAAHRKRGTPRDRGIFAGHKPPRRGASTSHGCGFACMFVVQLEGGGDY